MAKQEFSIPALMAEVPTEADAYLMLERLRWDGEPVCSHCGTVGRAYFLNPANGTSRKTRTGALSHRRVWKCGACRKQFSVLTGTVFHGSKIPLRTWLFVIFEMCASKNGVAAREIERKYDLTPKSAWFMLHRIREAMKREPLAGLLRGTIVADETYIGGSPKNRHRKAFEVGQTVGRGTEKTPVLSLVDTATGEVRSRVMNDVSGATLRAAIAENVAMKGSTLHTDKWGGYLHLGREFDSHITVDHGSGEYVRDGAGTNAAENFFSQLKRSIDGTHHHVSTEHLGRYLAEFDFRATTKDASDSQRMRAVVANAGARRLTFRPLTGE